MPSLLAITILGFTFSGRELAIVAVVVILVVGVIGWFANSRRAK